MARGVRGKVARNPVHELHTAAYVYFVHGRVGRFQVRANGEPVREMDVGDVLAKLETRPEQGSEWYTSLTCGHVPGDCRLLTVWKWKLSALE